MKTCDFTTKLFADGADINGMLEMYHKGIVKGFTTNPTLMKKAGVTDYVKFARQAIEAIPDMPLSFEVFSDDFGTMQKEAKTIAGWGKNVFVKIPITNTKQESSIPLIRTLSADGICVNVTAIMTIAQVEAAVNALTEGVGSYISVFAGRISDTGVNARETMVNTNEICHQKKGVESLWASCREVYNVIEANEIGVDIITVTNDILKKLGALDKDLTQFSLETVQMFYRDGQSLGFSVL